MIELKNPLSYWNDARIEALHIYQNLPEKDRTEIRQRLARTYHKNETKDIILGYDSNGRLNERIFRILVDFVPIEQAVWLFRCEIWGRFAQKKPHVVSIGGLWVEYSIFIKHIRHLQKAHHNHSEWFESERYTPEHIAAIFESEVLAIFMYIKEDIRCMKDDLSIMTYCAKRLHRSVKTATYKTDFLRLEILIQDGNNKEVYYDFETNYAKESIEDWLAYLEMQKVK